MPNHMSHRLTIPTLCRRKVVGSEFTDFLIQDENVRILKESGVFFFMGEEGETTLETMDLGFH